MSRYLKFFKMRSFVIQLFLFSLIAAAQAQPAVSIREADLDDLIARLKDSLGIPGVSCGIAHNDSIFYLKSFGYGNIARESALSVDDVWPVCSISKQFLAVSCQLLVREQKLNLNNAIEMYLPDVPLLWRGITIRQLLSHTSGIKDYLSKGLYGEDWELVMKSLASDSLDFQPGTNWNYSNTGYWLASEIVEKVSNQSYEMFLKSHCLQPLRLYKVKNISAWEDESGKVAGYYSGNGQAMLSRQKLAAFKGIGDGDLVATVADILSWEMALTSGRIIDSRLFGELLEDSEYSNSEKIRFEIPYSSGVGYGMGWFHKQTDLMDIYWTPGALEGYSTTVQYVPDFDLYIVVFCNMGEFLIADQIGFEIIREITTH